MTFNADRRETSTHFCQKSSSSPHAHLLQFLCSSMLLAMALVVSQTPNRSDSKGLGPVREQARSTCGLVAMTSASHAEGRQFDPGQVYDSSDSSQTSSCPHRLSGSWDAVEAAAFVDLAMKLTRESFAENTHKRNATSEMRKSLHARSHWFPAYQSEPFATAFRFTIKTLCDTSSQTKT